MTETTAAAVFFSTDFWVWQGCLVWGGEKGHHAQPSQHVRLRAGTIHSRRGVSSVARRERAVKQVHVCSREHGKRERKKKSRNTEGCKVVFSRVEYF